MEKFDSDKKSFKADIKRIKSHSRSTDESITRKRLDKTLYSAYIELLNGRNKWKEAIILKVVFSHDLRDFLSTVGYYYHRHSGSLILHHIKLVLSVNE